MANPFQRKTNPASGKPPQAIGSNLPRMAPKAMPKTMPKKQKGRC